MSMMGNRVVRTEDPRLLTVGGTYVADLRVPELAGALHVAFARSTAAHARLGDVEVEDARAMPGVVAVVTAADIDLEPIAPVVPMIDASMSRPVLARDVVRFVGEPIAAVVAESAAEAADAVDAIWADYDPLDAVVAPEAALDDSAPRLYEVGNVALGWVEPLPEDFFADCEVIVRQRVVNPRVAAVPLEGRSGAAAWVEGRLWHWAASQHAHGVRDALAGAYGLDRAQVRVITPDVGGGFGAKISASPEELILGWLARHVQRPVRWTETRSENLLAMGHGRGQVQQVAIGGRRDGRVLAYHLSIIQEAGAYPMVGALLPFMTRQMAPGTYDIAKVHVDFQSVVTNTAPTLAYRGAGRPEATAAIERAMDLFALECGLDPTEVRRTNLIAPEAFPVTTATGAVYDVGDYERALDLALSAAGYDALREEQRRRREAGETRLLGIGVSCYVEVTAGPSAGSEFARVAVAPDGTAVVYTGSSPHGQGLHTAFAQLAADRLGIPMADITVVHGDTDAVARGNGTMGSRSLQLGGSAVLGAAQAVVDRARALAAELLEAGVDDVVLDTAQGRFHVAGTPAVSKSWPEVAAAAEAAGQPLVDEHDFTASQPTYPFGAHVAVVEVDVDTGAVMLARLVAVDDAGRILNPLLADGQRHGGLAQGAAQALLEEIVYDEAGNPNTANLADYTAVTAGSVPSFELVPMETPTPVNPLGAKGIGESGTIGSTPAVQSAVVDAVAHLGVRHIDMPATPERVWQAIRG